VQKIFDRLFTGTVLLCLVSSAYLSYYMRPWRWLRSRRGGPKIPDDPFAQIPLPQSTNNKSTEKTEKAAI
jgi:hypothetical protein